MRRELIGDLLIIFLSGFILVHLVLMLGGPVLIYESCKPLLVVEISLGAGCLLLGLERLYRDATGKR